MGYRRVGGRSTIRATRGKLKTLEDLDGRSRSARVAKQILSGIESDLGGELTTGQGAIAQRAAVLVAMLEDLEVRWLTSGEIDLPAYGSAANTLRRLLATIGLERKARDISLPAYLNGQASAVAEPDEIEGEAA